MKYLYPPLLTLLPLLWATSLPVRSAEALAIDPHHSAVVFQWSHHGVSNPMARLEKIDGKLMLDGNDMTRSSVTVRLPLDGLRTGVDALDKRLKTPEFFDAARYPDITFASTAVEKGPGESLKIRGNLTMHGVTKPVVLDGKINKIIVDAAGKPGQAGFDATTTLRRADFGVDKYIELVAETLSVRISVDAYADPDR